MVTQSVLIVAYSVLDWPAVVANVTAVCVAAGPAYYANRRWVWSRTDRHSVTREILPFWAYSLAGLGISSLLVALPIDGGSPRLGSRQQISPGSAPCGWASSFCWTGCCSPAVMKPELAALAQRVKGFMPHDEGLALYRAAAEVAALGPLVEIGSYCGQIGGVLGRRSGRGGQCAVHDRPPPWL